MAASGDPTLALQAAVFARLNNDSTLTATLGVAVYDEVKSQADGTPNPSYPYVQLGDDAEIPNDTMGTTGRDVTIALQFFSRTRGMKQVKQIRNRLDLLLDRWLPTVSGWGATEMLFQSSEVFRDEDGITKRGLSEYRVTIYATS